MKKYNTGFTCNIKQSFADIGIFAWVNEIGIYLA